jgi:nitrate reductase assembly molybdenum cofactor insertion protein NarJ
MNSTLPMFDLLQRAAEWRLIALLLSRPSGDWARQIAALKQEIPDEELRGAADASARIAVTAFYDTIFGPGGPAAPREVSHRACLDGNFLAELTALYRAFAFQGPAGEPPDHVAVQSDFVSYLLLKQAYALSRSDVGQADIAANAARRVIEEHLGLIATPLAASLAASGIDYLAVAAAALLKRVGAPPHRSFSVPVLDDGSDASCSVSRDSFDHDDHLFAPA